MKSILLKDSDNNPCRIFIKYITCIRLQSNSKVLITLVCGTTVCVQETLMQIEELLK